MDERPELEMMDGWYDRCDCRELSLLAVVSELARSDAMADEGFFFFFAPGVDGRLLDFCSRSALLGDGPSGIVGNVVATAEAVVARPVFAFLCSLTVALRSGTGLRTAIASVEEAGDRACRSALSSSSVS